jgi:hypothetical protein
MQNIAGQTGRDRQACVRTGGCEAGSGLGLKFVYEGMIGGDVGGVQSWGLVFYARSSASRCASASIRFVSMLNSRAIASKRDGGAICGAGKGRPGGARRP